MFLQGFNYQEKNAFYSMAYCLIAADGVVLESESSLLEQFLDEMRLQPMDVQVVPLANAIDAMRSSNVTTKRQAFIELVGLGLCDEEIANEENQVLQTIADAFGFSSTETADLTNCVYELIEVYNKMGRLINK